ncbi:GGDEF domain-containing protein [Clostridium ljungdahlii]|uniref:Membrane associated GGDEF domain containing protein n=1 Tax=Clostridium ljungdahlii (strain ATCC 55383 / DSM 13528 / PETC) TaxID=748727 RepID=D8GQ54_CLOLD|nr:GGDEF domain-containing protein [Clostridium ljungdahlii]ADK16145.1 membrane associated GGDEF domain containing protein [Clostridium ljungdahlii DSM 13528]OAA82660.1 Response regulator PleD [Clostridium ljungdahlii DSM 13528]
MMIIEFFINFCVFITAISIICILFKDKMLISKSSIAIREKLFIGMTGGLLETLLLLFPIDVMPGLLVNFHALPIILSSLYGGVLSAIVTTIIINVLSYLIFKLPMVFLLTDLFLLTGFIFISNTKTTIKNKWVYCTLYSLVVSSIGNIILIKDSRLLAQFFIIYYIYTILLTYFIYKFIESLTKTFEVYKKYRTEASIDFLTGLNNVRWFNKSLNRISIAMEKKEKIKCLSLILLDIDYFKKINDKYGHSSGDIVLKNLANILNDTCRAFNIVSRNGGEEFSVLLLNYPAADAVQVAERIRKNIEAYPFHISDGITVHITISSGVSTYPSTTDNIDNLLDDTDTALYEAKNTGRNKVVLYKEENLLEEYRYNVI